MTIFRIHKTRGTCKIVNVEADRLCFEPSGVLSFWASGHLVMSYAPWAWKTACEDDVLTD